MKILLLLVCLFELHAAYSIQAPIAIAPANRYAQDPYHQAQSSLSVHEDIAAEPYDPYRRKRSDDYAYAQDQSSIVPAPAKRVAPTKRAAEQPDDATAVDGHGYEYQYQYAHPAKRAAEAPAFLPHALPAGYEYEYMPTYAYHAKRAAEEPSGYPHFLPQYDYIDY